MKKAYGVMLVTMLGVFLLGLGSSPAVAAEKQFKPQTACPLDGGPINKKFFVDYQGQRVYFCCPDCANAFRKDPEKYFSQFEKEGIELENIQTACPVCGDKLGEHGKPAVIHYKGRTVKFSCPACEKPFLAEPTKYLNQMPGEQQAKSSGKQQ